MKKSENPDDACTTSTGLKFFNIPITNGGILKKDNLIIFLWHFNSVLGILASNKHSPKKARANCGIPHAKKAMKKEMIILNWKLLNRGAQN